MHGTIFLNIKKTNVMERQDIEKVNTRIEEIVALGDNVGGISMLPNDLQDEYVRLSDIVYEYETEKYGCSWHVSSNIIPELQTRIESARKEYDKGNVTTLKNHNDIDAYLETL